jgi:hypothetical protein
MTAGDGNPVRVGTFVTSAITGRTGKVTDLYEEDESARVVYPDPTGPIYEALKDLDVAEDQDPDWSD